MADLHSRLRAEIERRLELAKAATPGPWFYNSYGAVFSSPLTRSYDAWVDPLIDAGHSLERRGECPACGDRSNEPYSQGCRHFSEDYDRDPLVASVPAHHGDTAIRRHQKDAAFMEANGPDVVLRHCERDLKVLKRHAHRPDGNAFCGGDIFLGQPCDEIAWLAASYAIPIDDQEQTDGDTT